MRGIIWFSVLLLSLSCVNSEYNSFKLCGLGITKPYYYTGLRYEGGLYAIRQYFSARYTPIQGVNTSGIVKIRFDVSCRGDVGNFQLETYSLNYKSISLNEDLTDQIFDLVLGLDKWIPGQDDEGNSVNSFKFLAFRIVEGYIIDILPK